MANLTKAQRHNKNLDSIFDFYRKSQELLPPCAMYARFLEMAVEKLNITIDEARNLYGKYTIKEWETLLKLGWNKN